MKRKEKIYFFHGLESAPVGTKSIHLGKHFEVESPDFQEMDIWERLEKAEMITEGEEEMVVVGSSFGGLLTALLYNRHPERFGGYVLMAPALHHPAAEEIEGMPPQERAAIIHGVDDEVVPLEAIKELCQQFGLKVQEVDDGHRLHGALDHMVAATQRVLGKD